MEKFTIFCYILFLLNKDVHDPSFVFTPSCQQLGATDNSLPIREVAIIAWLLVRLEFEIKLEPLLLSCTAAIAALF